MITFWKQIKKVAFKFIKHCSRIYKYTWWMPLSNVIPDNLRQKREIRCQNELMKFTIKWKPHTVGAVYKIIFYSLLSSWRPPLQYHFALVSECERAKEYRGTGGRSKVRQGHITACVYNVYVVRLCWTQHAKPPYSQNKNLLKEWNAEYSFALLI